MYIKHGYRLKNTLHRCLATLTWGMCERISGDLVQEFLKIDLIHFWLKVGWFVVDLFL
jgi:hypothetical protein